MSIKSITIENFKGIREPVKFELAPIVLLYGPNSAGKSTLLQALAYLNDIIVHDECNGNFTQVGGESMFLGDFASIVNEHDMSKNIKFTFEIDDLSGLDVVGFSSNPRNEYDGSYAQFLKNNQSKNDLPLLAGEIVRDGIFVEFTVAWDFASKKAFLSCCRFVVQDVEIINIKVKKWGEHSTIQFNFDHPCLKIDNSRYVLNPNPGKNLGWNTIFHCITHENSLLMSPDTQEIEFKKKGIFEWTHANEYGYPVYPAHMACFMVEFDKIEFKLREHEKKYQKLNKLFGLFRGQEQEKTEFLATEEGREAQKKWDEINSRQNLSTEQKYTNGLFVSYFSTVISGSFESIHDFLKDIIYIGPLRKRPDLQTIQQNATNTSWHDGMAAWQRLNSDQDEDAQSHSNEYVAEVNKYLGGQDYFNSGFHIKNKNVITFETELAGELQKLLQQDGEVDFAALRQQIDHNSKFKKILKLYDLGRGVDVDLTAVGTGISQIVPIIAAMVFDDVEVVMIEQPELHIHPRMQVQFGELMVDCLMSKRNHNQKQKLHLIETHSEALLLRLMRRIREPSMAGNRLESEDLAVYYVDMVDGATRIIKRIDIDVDGDFVDEWPGGFFEEAYVEKFGGR